MMSTLLPTASLNRSKFLLYIRVSVSRKSIIICLLVSPALVVADAPGGTGPDDALAPSGEWTSLTRGQEHWYALEYQGHQEMQPVEDGDDDEEEAVAIANSTDYGLVASVWSRDGARASAGSAADIRVAVRRSDDGTGAVTYEVAVPWLRLSPLVPAPGANLGLGCGNPLAFGEVAEGDIVLDLGSGAGIDILLAAKKVGPRGRVIGVDMTEAMIDQTIDAFDSAVAEIKREL